MFKLESSKENKVNTLIHIEIRPFIGSKRFMGILPFHGNPTLPWESKCVRETKRIFKYSHTYQFEPTHNNIMAHTSSTTLHRWYALLYMLS